MSDGTTALPLGLVWAQAHDGVIGASGSIPWYLPEDLAHFRRTTTGAPVIMGRATWESLPERFRPLPGRTNIVLSRRPDAEAPGAHVAGDLDEALAVASAVPGVERAWVIGGAQVYAEAMGRADLLVVTYVDVRAEGDAFAPAVGPGWTAVTDDGDTTGAAQTGPDEVSTTGLRYRFVTYRRTGDGAPAAQASSGSTSVV